MRRRPNPVQKQEEQANNSSNTDNNSNNRGSGSSLDGDKINRSGTALIVIFALYLYSSWSVYRYQFDYLPSPLSIQQAGKRGFSEFQALQHVKNLTLLGPHPLASDALHNAIQYVLAAAENIKKTAHWEVDVEVELFHVKSGVNSLAGGMFVGKTLVYSDLTHVVLRILPKYAPEAADNAILISSHIDSVMSAEGAGDCSSCVAVMLELARGVSQWAHGFKNAVIFLFNTGEEEGLNGAHSFISQHPWSSTIRLAVDLEAMGIGGKSGIFQAGPDPFAIENFASAAKYPSGHIVAQDLFASGVIKSATDFQVYKEVAGLSGLDFAYTDNSAVYHTKNDKLELLKPGSLQHLGENMLDFLLQIGPSSQLPKGKTTEKDKSAGDDGAIYFDILGMYMVTYRQSFAKMFYNSAIFQSLLIWTTSLVIGGYPAFMSLALSLLSTILMWVLSLCFSVFVAMILPLISSTPAPYVATPWLAIGLFGAPAVLGALAGQALGNVFLKMYLSSVHSKRSQLSPALQASVVKMEAERWLYKAGSMQWLILLLVGNYYKLGSCYMALVWLAPPAFAYGFLEATLTPARLPRPLKLATLLFGLAAPILISGGTFIRLAGTLIGMIVRLDRNPGSSPEWLGNVIIASFIAMVVCLTLVYLLSYVHLSDAKWSIIIGACVIFGISLAAVLSGNVPAFTEDTARAVNVVHVVDTTGRNSEKQNTTSYVSLFSTTPGTLTKEVKQIKEGFKCGRDKIIDFVTFQVEYGCLTYADTETGWSESDIPILQVERDDNRGYERITGVSVDTKSSIRWSLAINTHNIEDFTLKGDSEELVLLGDKSSVDGWHIIQFSGGKDAPTKFDLSLIWAKTSQPNGEPLLKLRTDVDRLTPKAERVLSKLPQWCSLFGKSTSPHTLAFLSSLPVDF
ncbi:hypothetical protein ACFE04_001990 [Oxalis oulophora]